MTASSQGAEQVANFLGAHPDVASVWYLGFLPKAHPDREVFERQCRGPGSTFSFEVKGGEAEAFSVLNRLPAQPVDATQALNLSAGVSNSKVFRGRSFS